MSRARPSPALPRQDAPAADLQVEREGRQTGRQGGRAGGLRLVRPRRLPPPLSGAGLSDERPWARLRDPESRRKPRGAAWLTAPPRPQLRGRNRSREGETRAPSAEGKEERRRRRRRCRPPARPGARRLAQGEEEEEPCCRRRRLPPLPLANARPPAAC